MQTTLATVEKTQSEHQATCNRKDIRARKYNLDKELENSLRLESAMLEMQQEFRNRGKSISGHVNRLGVLLGIRHVA